MKKKTKKTKPVAKTITIERLRTTPFPIKLTEDSKGVHVPNRVQLFKTGTFKKLQPDGKWIEFEITREILAEIVKNWKANVRGVDLAIDFAHKSDDEAAGWIKDLVLKEVHGETQLWAEVDWTPDGYTAVGGKKFRYLSPDFAFSYTDNESGERFGATLFGAGLTNRPVIKNMAPAVELTEVEDMAKLKTKKISEMTVEELKVRLAEEKDGATKDFIQYRLDEAMAEDDDEKGEPQGGDADDDSPEDMPAKGKKKEKNLAEMNMEELRAKCEEMYAEMHSMKKSMIKNLAEVAATKKTAQFDKMLGAGKVVEAQRAAFLEGDTIKFAELAQPTKFQAIGADGKPITTNETSAQVEVLKLAEEAVAAKKVKRSEAVSHILKTNPELLARYNKEMGY